MAGTVCGLDSGPGAQQRERKGERGCATGRWLHGDGRIMAPTSMHVNPLNGCMEEEKGPHFHAREYFEWLHAGVGPYWQLKLSGAEAEGGCPRSRGAIRGRGEQSEAEGEQSEADGELRPRGSRGRGEQSEAKGELSEAEGSSPRLTGS